MLVSELCLYSLSQGQITHESSEYNFTQGTNDKKKKAKHVKRNWKLL